MLVSKIFNSLHTKCTMFHQTNMFQLFVIIRIVFTNTWKSWENIFFLSIFFKLLFNLNKMLFSSSSCSQFQFGCVSHRGESGVSLSVLDKAIHPFHLSFLLKSYTQLQCRFIYLYAVYEQCPASCHRFMLCTESNSCRRYSTRVLLCGYTIPWDGMTILF